MSNWTNNDELRYYSWFDYDTETHVILPLQDKVNLYQISPSFFFLFLLSGQNPDCPIGSVRYGRFGQCRTRFSSNLELEKI